MTQPLDVLKTRAMNAKPGEFNGLWDIVKHTAKLGPLGKTFELNLKNFHKKNFLFFFRIFQGVYTRFSTSRPPHNLNICLPRAIEVEFRLFTRREEVECLLPKQISIASF
jgi:hypothetical protein